MQLIPEKAWAAFSSNQVELLVQDGIARQMARRFYQIQ
jgi:hypothetical protein